MNRRPATTMVLVATGLLLSTGCAPVVVHTERITGTSWNVPALLTDCDSPQVDPQGCTGPNTTGHYTSLGQGEVTQPWRLCSVLPHLKDQTWTGMNYGQANQAQQLGVALTTVDAGGYENLSTQVTQVEDCVSSGADAILLSAVSNESLNPAINAAKKQGVTVIDVGNGVSSTEVDARVLQDYYDMGKLMGTHIAQLREPMKVALLPGPVGTGWSERTRMGFEAAVADSQVEVVDVKYGDTGKEVQLRLVEDVLSANPDIDAIVGTAITTEVASTVLAEQGRTDEIRVYGTYVTPQSVELMRQGRINCAPSEQSSRIGKMSVDLAVRALQHHPAHPKIERYAPEPLMLCGAREGDFQNLDAFDATGSFAPEGWDPAFNVKASR